MGFGAANPYLPQQTLLHQIIIGRSTKFPPRITHRTLGVPAKFETKPEDSAHGGPEGIKGRVFERFKRALWIHRCARLILKKIYHTFRIPVTDSKIMIFLQGGPLQVTNGVITPISGDTTLLTTGRARKPCSMGSFREDTAAQP